jgi:hypothetical protein
MARVLYIGGVGRSGTTVLERALGELPGYHVLGETVHLWQRALVDDELCGCGRPFSGCPFWTAVGERAFGGWDRVDPAEVLALKRAVDRNRYIGRLAAPRLAADVAAQVARYVGMYRRLYEAVTEITGAAVVVDSSKHASLVFCLRWAPELDLRVLHAVRDVRGVAYSWTKGTRRPEATSGRASFMPTYSPTSTALRWDLYNSAFGVLARRGTPTLRVRYEEFVADPRGVLAAVADFAGAPVDEAGLAFASDAAVELTPQHTVSGNPVRFRTGQVPLRRDEAWRTELPARQRRAVALLASPLLRRYGYPLATRPE